LSGLAFSHHIGKSTLGKIIFETTEAIWEALKDEYLAPPTRQRWQEISEEFWRRWNFPLAVGAIDGKHFAIKVSGKAV
jgi:HD-like signal output (HDOD) protein